jgi:hypothetical protein
LPNSQTRATAEISAQPHQELWIFRFVKQSSAAFSRYGVDALLWCFSVLFAPDDKAPRSAAFFSEFHRTLTTGLARGR